MTTRNVSPDVGSTLGSIRSIISIVNGLTLTNTLMVLITGGRYSQILHLNELPTLNTFSAVVLMANIVRFYHGNMRHLDSAYGPESINRSVNGRHVEPRGGIGLDFFVMFGQSLMFAVASFYIGSGSEFLSIFIYLLITDVIWTIYSQQSGEISGESPQRSWLLNNLVSTLVLVGLYTHHRSHPDHDWTIIASLVTLAVTTIVDYGLNWTFYFPRTHERD